MSDGKGLRSSSGQFVKGSSGNPKGRPKKPRNESGTSVFDVLLDQVQTVTVDGIKRQLTIDERLQIRRYQDALTGSVPACREIIEMIKHREMVRRARVSKKVSGLDLRIEPTDPHNIDEVLVLLGIATTEVIDIDDGNAFDRLLIEPWAAQMSLSRGRGRQRLSEEDIGFIEIHTRNPDTLRWPRGTKKESDN